MLCAHTRFRPGHVEVDFDVALERSFRLFSIRRTRTMLDTRILHPNGTSSDRRAVLYIMLDGELQWHAPETLSLTAPGAFVAPLRDLVGGSGRRARSYRSGGPFYQSLQLWVPTSYLPRDCDAPTALSVSDATLRAARAYAELVHGGGPPADAADRELILRRLFASLLSDGALTIDLSTTIVSNEGIFGRVWEHVQPWFEVLALSGSLDALASRAGVSLRQMGRRLDDLGITFELPFQGWRALGRGMRLRLAILLLSNPDLSITTVAETAGYSSAEALSHALRAEGLPPPFEIRTRVADWYVSAA
jgi:AraC-like DNA-binding protein